MRVVGRRIIAELSIGADGKLLEKVNPSSPELVEDPFEGASAYAAEGADEILFRGVDLSFDALTALYRRAASSLRIPSTVEFDAANPSQVEEVLEAGASRVILQDAALRDPDYLARLAKLFAGRRIAVRILASSAADGWRVLGRADGAETEWNAVTWARVIETQGAGSLFVGSASQHAIPSSFDLDLLDSVKSAVAIPVIASGAAERVEDVFDALMIGNADGVVVRELLHSGRTTVGEIRAYLLEHGLEVGNSDQ